EPREDLLRTEDVEPLRDARTDTVRADQDLTPEATTLSVLVHQHLDAAVVPPRRGGLGSQERVRAASEGLRHDRAIEHRPVHDDGLRLPARPGGPPHSFSVIRI